MGLWTGADVTRQLNWMDSEPSIAALVGSMDPHAALYSTVVQLQSRNSEVIMVLPPSSRSAVFYHSNSGSASVYSSSTSLSKGAAAVQRPPSLTEAH